MVIFQTGGPHGMQGWLDSQGAGKLLHKIFVSLTGIFQPLSVGTRDLVFSTAGALSRPSAVAIHCRVWAQWYSHILARSILASFMACWPETMVTSIPAQSMTPWRFQIYWIVFPQLIPLLLPGPWNKRNSISFKSFTVKVLAGAHTQ